MPFTTIMYNLYYALHAGLTALSASRKYQSIYVIYILFFVALFWLTRRGTPVMRLFLLLLFFAVGLLLLFCVSDLLYRGKTNNAFQQIGFHNCKGELPVLKKKITQANSLLELHFLSRGIPLAEWCKQQLSIENALDITISQIKYGTKNCQDVIVTACIGRMDFYSSLLWNDKNRTDYFSTSLILGMSMGQLVYNDLRINPHVLIGGATGSGKTLLLKHMLLQCIQKDYRIVILDYKGGVDFSANMWHMHTSILLEKDKMLKGLSSIIDELQYRQRIFAESKCSNIDEYNKQYTALPRIILGCDEVSDLLDITGLSKEEKELTKEIHAHLNTLIRKGRAFGIHLFLATQRPAADIIGGALKNNTSCRVAGKCDEVLSRMILDDSIAADMVPKDSVGVFVNQDKLVFKGFIFDENTKINIPFHWYGEGDLSETSNCTD